MSRTTRTHLTDRDRELVDAAVAARAHAYAPYSRFRVGAAARARDGRLFAGVNVENASYGLTVCAERHALAAAVAAGTVPGEVTAIAVATTADPPAPPCGACRQVMQELAAAEAAVFVVNADTGALERYTVAELLPDAFARAHLRTPP